MTNTTQKQRARPPDSKMARTHGFDRDEAINPAASAQHIELKFINTESTASFQVTPPSKKTIVRTGRTASQRSQRPHAVNQTFGEYNFAGFQWRQEKQAHGAFAPFAADAVRREQRHQHPDGNQQSAIKIAEHQRSHLSDRTRN